METRQGILSQPLSYEGLVKADGASPSSLLCSGAEPGVQACGDPVIYCHLLKLAFSFVIFAIFTFLYFIHLFLLK